MAGPHLARAERGIASFGQGCEGEPLLQTQITKVPEDKVFNTDGETFYAVYMKSIGSGSVIFRCGNFVRSATDDGKRGLGGGSEQYRRNGRQLA